MPCVRPISRRVLEFPRALFEHFAEARDVLFDELRGFAHEQRLRRVDYVVRGESVMQPARRFGIAHRFLHRDRERDHVVADLGLDFVDARDVDARAFAKLRGSLARDNARLGERVRRGQLDVEPLPEFVLVAPDAAHLRTRVSCDQSQLLGLRKLAGETPCSIIPEKQRTEPCVVVCSKVFAPRLRRAPSTFSRVLSGSVQ